MYPLVRELAVDGIPVTVSCRVLDLARAAYYRWLDEPITDGQLDSETNSPSLHKTQGGSTSADLLIFDDNERNAPDDLTHHLEAINQLDPDEQQAIRTLIEGALLRHQARKLAG